MQLIYNLKHLISYYLLTVLIQNFLIYIFLILKISGIQFDSDHIKDEKVMVTFALYLNENQQSLKIMFTGDVKWVIQPQINKCIRFLIYPESEHFWSCNAVFKFRISLPDQLGSHPFKEFKYKFNQKNNQIYLNLGLLDAIQKYCNPTHQVLRIIMDAFITNVCRIRN